MPISLDLVSVLLLLSIGQCAFLLIVLALNYEKNNQINLLLALLIILFTWYQLEFFVVRNKIEVSIPFLLSTRFGSWLFIGPLIYLLVKATTSLEFKLKSSDLTHFTPGIVFAIIIPIISGNLTTDRSVDYGMLTVFDSWNREEITWKHYLYSSIFILQFFHGLTYLLITLKVLLLYRSEAKNQLSSFHEQNFNTMLYLIYGGIITIVFVSSFIGYQFITFTYRRNADYFHVLPFAVVIYGISYRAVRYPNSVISFEKISSKIKYEKSSLSLQASAHYLEKLEKVVSEEKVYRMNELRLSDLAKKLEMTTHHLSQIINEKKNQSFFDYINSMRVEEAKELILSHQQKTLLEIAHSVGFNNKNSFSNAFKKHAGMNPSSYKKLALAG